MSTATTTIEQQNVETVRRGFNAFLSGDAGTLTALFREDAEWHGVGAGVLKDSHCVGRDAIFAMFALLQKETNGSFRPEPISAAAAGDTVFVRSEARGERNGRQICTDEVLIFQLAGGLVKEVRVYVNDYPEYERAWS